MKAILNLVIMISAVALAVLSIAIMSSCSHVCSVMYAEAHMHIRHQDVSAFDFCCFYMLHMYLTQYVAKCTVSTIIIISYIIIV